LFFAMRIWLLFYSNKFQCFENTTLRLPLPFRFRRTHRRCFLGLTRHFLNLAFLVFSFSAASFW
jgi:hypothetical protein